MESLVVTLIGSFRKDRQGLEKTFGDLTRNFELISPRSIDFVDKDVEFVKAKHEMHDSTKDIEERVLSSIAHSDFVWLHAPDGYVGVSAAFEIGYAHSIGVPIYTDTLPKDEMLQTMTTGVIKRPQGLKEVLVHEPGKGLASLQAYYARIAERRGWGRESAKDAMLLMTEEIGELARAIRKTSGLKRDTGYKNVELEDEMADVQLYLTHLANILDVDLGHAVTNKERKNHTRYLNS